MSKSSLRGHLWRLASLLVVMALLLGCAAPAATPTAAPAKPAAPAPTAAAPAAPAPTAAAQPAGQLPDPIKVGTVLPMTGPNAAFGEEEKRGLELAVDKINARGGIKGSKLQLIVEDDKGQAAGGVSAAEKLMTQDKVFAIVGGYGSTTAFAMLEALKKYKTIYLGVGASASNVAEKYGPEDWLYFFVPFDWQQQETVNAFVKSLNPKPQKIAVAYEDKAWGTFNRKVFVEGIQPAGYTISADEPYTSGASDYTALLTKLKGTNPDLFRMIAYAGDAILMTRQMKELKWSPKLVVGQNPVEVEEYIKALGPTADYVVGYTFWNPSAPFKAAAKDADLLPSTADWVKAYRAKYNDREPNYAAMLLTYIPMVILAQAIERVGALDRDKVIAELDKTDTMTPAGQLKFQSAKMVKKQGFADVWMFQWQKGQKVLVYPEAVKTGELVYPAPAWDKR